MYLAVRKGNGPVLLPDAYRRQYLGRGWTLKAAPSGYEPVSQPTPLSQATKTEAVEAPQPKRKRGRRGRGNSES